MENFTHLDLAINSNALEICKTLTQAGYQAFIVGGCVRDLLLGVKPKDWDITTNATPEKIMELFPKTYPTGIQHGTVTVNMNGEHFEVTTFRVEGKYHDGRRPEKVIFVNSIEEDLSRRDLTINAIAYNPIVHKLIDPFNGSLDLQNKIIQTVGCANHRFQEDGLRIMRAIRFAARFGYIISNDTLYSISKNLDTLKKVSMERIKDELCKTMMTKKSSYGFNLFEQTGILKVFSSLLPEKELYLHYISHLDSCDGELETKLALLYANCPISQVEKELIHLKFSNKEIKKIIFLLELLDRYNIFINKDTTFAYKSFMAVIKNHSHDDWLHTLNQFIILSEVMGWDSRAVIEKYKSEIVFSKKDLQINGNDLLELGIQGAQIKKTLDCCYLEILRNPHNNNKKFLLTFIQTL